MMPDTPEVKAQSESVNARLATHLSDQKEAILHEFLNRLRRSTEIETDALTVPELRNHAPKIVDDLVRELRQYKNKDAAQQTSKDAAIHGATRWRQGFDLHGLLRECSQFRAIFIYHLRIFEETNPDFGFTERYFADATMHRILDDVTIDAAQQFLAIQRLEKPNEPG